MRIAHKTLGVSYDLPELTQRMVEDLFAGLRAKGTDDDDTSAPEYAGAVVRTADELGWLDGIGPVGDLKPNVCVWLSGEINNLVAEALTVPPE